MTSDGQLSSNDVEFSSDGNLAVNANGQFNDLTCEVLGYEYVLALYRYSHDSCSAVQII